MVIIERSGGMDIANLDFFVEYLKTVQSSLVLKINNARSTKGIAAAQRKIDLNKSTFQFFNSDEFKSKLKLLKNFKKEC